MKTFQVNDLVTVEDSDLGPKDGKIVSIDPNGTIHILFDHNGQTLPFEPHVFDAIEVLCKNCHHKTSVHTICAPMDYDGCESCSCNELKR